MSKYALCVGINAYPAGSELSGCINDAADWGEVLAQRGYSVAYLLDGEATLENIKDALRKLVDLGHYRDRIVFTYSGHGTWEHDVDGDESDNRDEAICPVDCFSVGMLFDDEIRAIMSHRRYGVRAAIMSDSCHSGSVNRFMSGMPTRATFRSPRFIPPYALPIRIKPRESRALIATGNVLLSGCLDTEYSYDAWFGDRPNGAFTRVAIDALRNEPKTYKDWMAMINATLPNDDYPQTPRLSASYYRSRWVPLA